MTSKPELITRRSYLIREACLAGADPLMAIEAVSSVAIEHPEWDMDELATYAEWCKKGRGAMR